MGHDDQTVPVTVTVQDVPTTPGPPHHPLPFTGAPIVALTAIGLLLALMGALVVLTFRRRRRSLDPRSFA